jgi:hypothetical protein
MKPSLTTAGSKWVEMFGDAFKEPASLLIDSLEIHDQTRVLNSIIQKIRFIASNGPDPQPILLIPIRSMEDLPLIESDLEEHVAYKTFNPGSSFPALPGSEADIGGVIRTLVQADPEVFLSPEITLDELRERKVRSICLVTDYSGSGNQALRFAQAFMRNSTIASWISYGFVKINIVSYAASLDASALFRNQKHVHFWTSAVVKSAASADWSEEQRTGILDFCVSNADTVDNNLPLGYGGSFGLYLTNLRVPNNLPQVLIRSGGNPPGLFAGREMPAEFYKELPVYTPAPSLDRLLRNLGAEDLADLLLDETRPIRALRTLATLHLLDYGIPSAQIDAMLGLDEHKSLELRSSLIALECMTLDGFLTKRGRVELKRARHRGWLPRGSKHTHSGAVPYIPSQLR